MPTLEKKFARTTVAFPDSTGGDLIAPGAVIAALEKYILVDGFKIVIDLERSHGSRLVDAANGRELVDLYSFYASTPIGYNHPYLNRPEVEAELLAAARIKVANADVYSVFYAQFVETFARVMPLPPLRRFFFIEGGALAVENALKAAMDWKVRKNLAAGRGERGTEVLHFESAFHGRSGYTMSLTNTDPGKIAYFAKFPWPRIISPSLDFSLSPGQREEAVIAKEKLALKQIHDVLAQKAADIAAIIIDPTRGKGGSNTAGRVTSLIAHPADPRRLWAGAATGGVWRSADGGGSWQSCWPKWASQKIGALAIEPAD